MPTYTATIEYQVSRDGTAHVVERRSLQNESDTPLIIPCFEDTLPRSIDLQSIKCYLEYDGDKATKHFSLLDLPGTDRKRIRIPREGEAGLMCPRGTTSLVTEFRVTSFYHVAGDSGLYIFCFHHVLPPLEYLKDQLVPKKICVAIEKPARFFSKWRLFSLDPPAAGYHRQLVDLSDEVCLEFNFQIGRTQFYSNTVVMVKKHRVPLFEVFRFAGTALMKWAGAK